MAREAVDPGTELEPALPVAHPHRRAAAGPRRRLRLDPGDRRVGRGSTVICPTRRRRIPAAGPSEPICRAALGRTRRWLELAALRVDPPAVDERWREGPFRVRSVARAATRPQPGDAGRGVARTTFVIGRAARPDRRWRLGCLLPHPGRRGSSVLPGSSPIRGLRARTLIGASFPAGPSVRAARIGPPGPPGPAEHDGGCCLAMIGRLGRWSRLGRSAGTAHWAGTGRSAGTARSVRPARFGAIAIPEPGERTRSGRILERRWLAPRRHLPDERHPRVQLAHPVDEAETLGGLGRARLGRQSLARPLEELGEPAVRLEVPPDHDRVVRLERLRDPVHERPREPERVAHLAHGRARPVRDEVADHPGVLGAVALVDVLDDLLAPFRAEVDVDVRVGRPARIDEPLEQEVVGDRLDPADPEGVRHDRAGRAAPALGRDPLLLREAHQVPADEEELGEAGSLDDLQLVGEALDDRGGHRVVALARTCPAQLRQVRERGLPAGHREAREPVLLEAEIDRARRRELHRRRQPRRPRPRRPVRRRGERRQLRAGLQVRLAIGPAQVAERVQRPAVPDRAQDVGQLTVLRASVVDVIGDDDREAGRLGQRRRLRDEPVVVGQEVMRELDEEAARGRPVAPPEERRVPLGNGPSAGPIARPKAPDQLPVAAAGQRDQTLGVLGEQGLAEPRHALGAGHVGPRHETAQAPPADLRAGQQDEVGTANAFVDAAQVLLDRVAMAGQPGTPGARPARQALGHGRVDERGVVGDGPVETHGRRVTGPSPARAPWRHDDPGRIGDGRVQQLDLETDDRVETGGLRRADEPDRPVQAVVVRDGQPGQAELDRALDQVVGRGRPVEEREVGVGMEFGVGGRCHGSLRSGPADWGPQS